jgi:hypothetical protein
MDLGGEFASAERERKRRSIWLGWLDSERGYARDYFGVLRRLEQTPKKLP